MGRSQQESHGQLSEYVGPNGMINRKQLVRLLEQELCELGYVEVAAQLERVSVCLWVCAVMGCGSRDVV